MSILDLILGQGLSPDQFNDRFNGEPPRSIKDEQADQDMRDFWMKGAPYQAAPAEDDQLPPGARPTSGPLGIPLNVPLPRPRPPEASPIMTPDVMSAVDQFAPTDVQRAARGQPPLPQGDEGGLGSLVTGPKMANFARSLAAGLSNVKNSPFAAQTFSNAAGGAMQGGQKFEDEQDAADTKRKDTSYAQRLQALDRLLKMKQMGSTAEYQKGLLEYRNRFADAADAKVANQSRNIDRLGAATRPGAKTILESERLIGAREKQAGAAIDKVRNDFSLTPEQKQAKIAEIEKGRDAYAPNLRKRLGVDDNAGEPPEIDMGGQGTRDAPFQPQTAEDYQNIEPGTYYIHPGDGKLRLKK